MTWQTARRLPHGTALLVDLGHGGKRTVGRLARVTETELVLTTQDGEAAIRVDRIARARRLDGVFRRDDLVVKLDVPATYWRGAVVSVEGDVVVCETLDGIERVPAEHLSLATKDGAAAGDKRTYAGKPGVPASDPIKEAINTAAYAGAAPADEDEWAV